MCTFLMEAISNSAVTLANGRFWDGRGLVDQSPKSEPVVVALCTTAAGQLVMPKTFCILATWWVPGRWLLQQYQVLQNVKLMRGKESKELLVFMAVHAQTHAVAWRAPIFQVVNRKMFMRGVHVYANTPWHDTWAHASQSCAYLGHLIKYHKPLFLSKSHFLPLS